MSQERKKKFRNLFSPTFLAQVLWVKKEKKYQPLWFLCWYSKEQHNF